MESWRKLVFTYKKERDRFDIFWIKHSCLPRSGFQFIRFVLAKFPSLVLSFKRITRSGVRG